MNPAVHVEATKLARSHGLKVEVFGPKEVARIGMGSFMGVAKGSAEPLRFITLRTTPSSSISTSL